MKKLITVRVPATSANLGPGFDCLGAAVELYNDFSVELLGKNEDTTVIVQGAGKGDIPENKKNLVYQTIEGLFRESKKKVPAMRLTLNNNIPVVRGLGSSASALVGGLVLGDLLLGKKYSLEELISKAVAIEGHADNIVPAFVGGLCITRFDEDYVQWWRKEISNDLCACVCVPEFMVSTKKARTLIPLNFSRKTSVFNACGVAMFVALVTSKPSYERDRTIRDAMRDRFHQPHRKKLVPGMQQVFEAGMKAGALGVALSGSGPSIIAMVKKNADIDSVGKAMVRSFAKHGIVSNYKILKFIANGARKV